MDTQTDQVLAYHCPTCGAALAFDPVSGNLKCSHCESVFTTEEIDAAYQEEEAERAAERTGDEWKTYSCTDCGAELMADQNTAVIQCPYCGNNTIATAQFAGSIRPNSVIPFGITKDQAMAKYREYYSSGLKKFLLPGSFHTGSHVEEIQGVYIPFWLYQGTAKIEGDYEVSNKKEEGDFEVTEHYHAQRNGSMNFSNVPADASKRMADDLMDSIEPYDFSGIKPFSMSYLPGFLAERFDVNEKDTKKRAEKRISETITHKTRETLKYDSIDKEKAEVKVNFGRTKYALLPAWILTTKWDNKEWTFAMNAQSGKFTGNLPMSKGKFLLFLCLLFFVPFLLGMVLGSTGVGTVIGVIVTLIGGLLASGSMKPVAQAGRADRYMDAKVNLSVKTDQFVRKEKKKKEQK